jgi:GT2 family glycosyltransferase
VDGQVSVVVTFLRRDPKVEKCLSLIRAQTHPPMEIVEGRPDLGEGRSYADAASRAKGEWVAFTNADCYVPPDWLERLLSRASEGFEVVGGPRLTIGDIYSYAWNTPYGVLHDMRSGLAFGWSNCLIRRSVLDRVPLRDLKSNQDLDFLIRAYKAGIRVCVDWSLVVVHDHPLGSLRNAMRRQFLASENYTYLLRLHHGTVAKTGLGLHVAFFRFMRGFLSAGRLQPRYGNLAHYCFVRFWVKVAQLCGFAAGVLRDGVVDIK